VGLKELLRRGSSLQSVSRGQGGGGFNGGLWGAGLMEGGRNWNREAGLRYDNSIVYSAIMYAWNALTEVDIYVDICTPARWTDDRVIVVDLDFDVILWNAARSPVCGITSQPEPRGRVIPEQGAVPDVLP